MKQKHTQAKKARRFNDWTCYQLKSGWAFGSYLRLLGMYAPIVGMMRSVL